MNFLVAFYFSLGKKRQKIEHRCYYLTIIIIVDAIE